MKAPKGQPPCYVCDRPARALEYHTFGGTRAQLCVRCGGRVLGLMRLALEAIGDRVRDRIREVSESHTHPDDVVAGLDEALVLMGLGNGDGEGPDGQGQR